MEEEEKVDQKMDQNMARKMARQEYIVSKRTLISLLSIFAIFYLVSIIATGYLCLERQVPENIVSSSSSCVTNDTSVQTNLKGGFDVGYNTGNARTYREQCNLMEQTKANLSNNQEINYGSWLYAYGYAAGYEKSLQDVANNLLVTDTAQQGYDDGYTHENPEIFRSKITEESKNVTDSDELQANKHDLQSYLDAYDLGYKVRQAEDIKSDTNTLTSIIHN